MTDDPVTHLRIRSSTLKRLRALMAGKVAAMEVGRAEQNWPGEALTDGAMVSLLIDHVENDRRRVREAKARRRERAWAEVGADEYVPTPQS